MPATAIAPCCQTTAYVGRSVVPAPFRRQHDAPNGGAAAVAIVASSADPGALRRQRSAPNGGVAAIVAANIGARTKSPLSRKAVYRD
jgi:hypothetical protein